MIIDLSRLSHTQVYANLVQTLVPRPVAWVLSENANGRFNLAPFSYFNAVCSDPPLVMLSIGLKPDGTEKDTRVNIRERDRFVVHIAHRELAKPLTESSATLPPGESELDRLGLPTVPFEGFAVPRLAQCRVAYACERYEIRELGPRRQALILGLVKLMFIDDAVVTHCAGGRIKVAAAGIDPIGRLGASEYVTFGEILDIPRPQ